MHLLWVLPLGLLAGMPIGAVLGSTAKSPGQMFPFVILPLMVMMGISGIFYPLAALPQWLQYLGQVFPMYWLGHGLRAALLPEAAVAAEIGGVWRLWGVVVVPGLWALVGMLLAPVYLRRMARHQSGSTVEKAREKHMMRYS